MWVDKEIIPALIDFGQSFLDEGKFITQNDPETEEYGYRELETFQEDVQDLLLKYKDVGFELDKLDSRGAHTLCSLIEPHLLEKSKSLSKSCIGGLILLYYSIRFKQLSTYSASLNFISIQNDIPYLNAYLRNIKLGDEFINLPPKESGKNLPPDEKNANLSLVPSDNDD